MNSNQVNGPTPGGMLAGLPRPTMVDVQVEVVAREAILGNEVKVPPAALADMLRSSEDRAKLRSIPRADLYDALLAGITADDEALVQLTVEGLAGAIWLGLSRAERRMLRESIAANGNRAWAVIGPLESSIGPWQKKVPTQFAMNSWRLYFGECGHA